MYKKLATILGVSFIVVSFLPVIVYASVLHYERGGLVNTTLYQNTTGFPLAVSADYSNSGVGNIYSYILVASTTAVSSSNYDAQQYCYAGLATYCAVYIIVPVNDYYELISNSGILDTSRWSIPFANVLVATSTAVQVDNANFDYIMGVLMFFGMLGLIVWFFRRYG